MLKKPSPASRLRGGASPWNPEVPAIPQRLAWHRSVTILGVPTFCSSAVSHIWVVDQDDRKQEQTQAGTTSETLGREARRSGHEA